jgi:CPA2 family monovalent cation:H+ antiporter-2
MDAHDFLRTLAMVLVTAGLTAVLFQRMRLPVVFGYMAAGLIVSPHFPLVPITAHEDTVKTLSELGVILLMFALGLEFSLRRMIRIFATAGTIAVAQCALLILLGYLTGQAFGWTGMESVFAGAIIAISSTTIIVKAFEEQDIKGSFTDLVFGILIVEDLIAILLLAMLTTASASGGVSAGAVGVTSARLLVFLVVFLAVGLLLIPRTARYIVRVGRPETIVVAIVGLAFASALVALAFGYSVALGAFLAGALTSESGVGTVIEHAIQPVRDLFAAIFFVAVGMLIEPVLIAQNWQAVLILTGLVITGKVVGVGVAAFLTGYSVPTSVRAGMSLAQIGEFSFIIAGVGLASGVTRPFLYPVAIAVSAITTLTTPWLIRVSQPVANRVDRSLPPRLQTFVALYGSWIERIRSSKGTQPGALRMMLLLVFDVLLITALVIGFALELPRLTNMISEFFALGPVVARTLVLVAAALLATPLAIGFLRTSRLLADMLALRAFPTTAQGQVDYSVAPRRALATTLRLAMVAVSGVVLVALTQPFLPAYRGVVVLIVVTAVFAIAFWRNAANFHGHARAGAEILAQALSRQLPATAPAPAAAARAPNDNVARLMSGFGEPVAWQISQDSPVLGRTLAELNLRSRTGATVLAIHRADGEVILPTGSERLQAGDVLVLAGTREAMEAGRELLTHTST